MAHHKLNALPVLVLVAGGIATASDVSPVTVPVPTELTPMTVGAALTPTHAAPGQVIAVLIGVRLRAGWHTYAQVPPDEPYVQTRGTLEPGPGLAPSGDWLTPPPVADSQNPELKIYESGPDPLMFLHDLKVSDSASGELKVRVGVRFQTCNAERCLPPAQKFFDLKVKVVPK